MGRGKLGCAAGWGHIFMTGLEDYYKWGCIFNRVTRMGLHIFGFFRVRQFFTFTVSKRTRMFVLYVKSKVSFFQSKKIGQFIKIESD